MPRLMIEADRTNARRVWALVFGGVIVGILCALPSFQAPCELPVPPEGTVLNHKLGEKYLVTDSNPGVVCGVKVRNRLGQEILIQLNEFVYP